mmetsp:Transcript_31388/g.47890  ORF Transcript_31388/g.47890 Transcript_31388/m.47890 type:complete len:560 (+) Transcript_31388:89-1768(+)
MKMLRASTSAAIQTTAAAALASVAGYGTYLYNTDEGTRRAFKAYRMMVPAVLEYRFLEAQSKVREVAAEEWLALDQKHAAPVVARLGELQGMYTKYGQTSAGLTNTFSDAWIQQLRKLEDKVPPRTSDVVIRTIEEETGKPIGETFCEFDETPLGSASIGQVHRARLKADGREVAVKVQYPESEATFRTDITAIRDFCSYLAPEHLVTLNALEKQNAGEINYIKEANNLIEVGKNMEEAGFQPREAVVPKALPELSTRRMLVMELLPGPKLNDGIRSYYSSWALKNGTTIEKLEAEAKKKIEEEGIPAKYDGPSAQQIESYLKFLLRKDYLINSSITIYNWTLGQFLKKIDYREPTEAPPNTPRIIDTLMRVHGHQLLKNGVFNADPHGGNFLLLPDGRIGLIDYGATKRLTEKERITACVLYAALQRNDEDMLYNMSTIGGYKSKYNRKDVLMKLMQFAYNSYGKDVTGDKNIQQFIDDLKAKDPWEETPDNYVMASFMSIRLRSVAIGMNHPVKCSEWWGPMAERILEEEGHPYESWDYDKLVENKPELNIFKQKWN